MREGIRRVVISGHDLKFIQPLITYLEGSPRFEVRLDEHPDHAMASREEAKEHLAWADVIFCEWAMGNAVWYSRNKKPSQRLVVRLHLQEIQARLSFLWKIDWGAVDNLVCICHHIYDQMLAEFPQLSGKARIVYNPIDASGALALPKMPMSEFNLGFVGMVPLRKRLDLALDIFLKLRDTDDRYCLHVKGRRAEDYPWMLQRTDEMASYRELDQRIASSPYCHSVVFDPHGADMPSWYSAMGFVLSTSDFEGSHQAVAEGMAAGCIPCIRDWEGADRIYPSRFVFHDLDEAVSAIRSWHRAGVYNEVVESCRDFASSRFDSGVTVPALVSLIEGTGTSGAATTRAIGRGAGIAVMGYIQPGSRNGYRIRIEQEVKQYRRICKNLTLIVLHDAGKDADLDAHQRELEALGCRVELVRVRDFFAIGLEERQVLESIKAVERLIAEYQVEVLHVEALYSMRFAGFLRPRYPNLRIMFDDHGVSPEEEAMIGAAPARVDALERIERAALSQADVNVFVSTAMAEHYRRKYGYQEERHLLLPCCVEDKFFQDDVSSVHLDVPEGRTVIGYAGTLSAWQCGLEMIALFARLAERDPNLFLLLLLPKQDHAKALEAAERAELSADKMLLTEVSHDEVPGCLRRVDIGLLLRRDDPVNRVSSPTKFAEYLASGVPVLMTRHIGDYSRVVEKARLGCVLDEVDILGDMPTAEAIEMMLDFVDDVRGDRSAWAERCRAYAREHLAWGSAMNSLYHLLGVQGPDACAPQDPARDMAATGVKPFMLQRRHQVIPAKQLQPKHLRNARVLFSRWEILPELKQGGVWGEVGVAFGDFSRAILDRIRPQVFHAIDLFDLEKHEVVFGRKSEEALKGKTHLAYYNDRFSSLIEQGQVVIHQGFSTDVLARFDDETFDGLYIDAGHDYDSVKQDLDFAKHKLKRDGVIIMNDYVMSNPFDGQLFGVVQATNELCVEEDWEIIFLALHPFMFCDVAIRRIDS